jgi:hypothetical protein
MGKLTGKDKPTPTSTGRAKKARALVAPGAVVLTLDEKSLQAKVQECLRATGKATLRMSEVSVTALGEVVDASVIVN